MPEKDNRTSGRLMWVVGLSLWCFFWLPIIQFRFPATSGSTQGLDRNMYLFNWIMLGIVFYGTNIMLFFWRKYIT